MNGQIEQFRDFAAKCGYELPQRIEPGKFVRFGTNGKPGARGDELTGLSTAEHFTVGNTAPPDIKQRAKHSVVTLALWGLLPADVATWLIQAGGLRHE